jgi:predicted metal-dependent enzyme (double-stranded beta helix superfamily)
MIDGTQALVAMVDAAVAAGDPEQITVGIRSGLCELIGSRQVSLPARFSLPAGDHYARRLVHRDEVRGYSIVAMTWGPGQATPLHDHAGMWCVEGVWQGSIAVTQYELVASEDGRYRFARNNTYQAGVGSAGCLIPPHEYHVIENAGGTPALSIHVYGGEMNRCNVFAPLGGGWFARQEKPLSLDE